MELAGPVHRAQPGAIRREGGHAEDRAAPFQGEHLLPALRVPELDRFPPITARRDACAVGRERHRMHAEQMTAQQADLLERGRAPQLDRAFLARMANSPPSEETARSAIRCGPAGFGPRGRFRDPSHSLLPRCPAKPSGFRPARSPRPEAVLRGPETHLPPLGCVPLPHRFLRVEREQPSRMAEPAKRDDGPVPAVNRP